jgi:3-hydroxyisobutyrate dehydrogenase-like beta-hydroxyacid dehydrogenase
VNIGFLGLGNMGSAIAGRLLQRGYRLTVWNRSRQAALALAGIGARVASTAEEAFQSEVVISMLGDDEAVRAVIIDSGVLGRANGGAPRVHVNMATISVALADQMAELHRDRGIAYVAAPVLGRPDVARAGNLNILVAGPTDETDGLLPILGVIGQKNWNFGHRASRANVVKLAINFMLAAAIETLGEAAALVTGYGVDASALFSVANQTFFPGPVYEGYGRVIAEERFEPAGFKARLGWKDVRLALAAAEAATTAMPVGSQIRDAMLEALARGDGEKEFGAVLGRSAMRRAGR